MVNKAIFIATILVCLPFLHLLAQPDPGRDPSGAPIDGGISLLVAAGIGYGVKKVRDARKKAKIEEEK